MTRVNMTKEDKFKESLKAWKNETRPFIRDKENKERDEFDYKRKYEAIKKEREAVAKETGDELENINIWCGNNLQSQSGNIIDRTPIKEDH